MLRLTASREAQAERVAGRVGMDLEGAGVAAIGKANRMGTAAITESFAKLVSCA